MIQRLLMLKDPPRSGRSLTALALTAFLVGAASVACTTHTSAQAGGQLVWGKPADAAALDPTISGTAASWELFDLTYETLVGLGDNLKVVPELAESWQQTSPTTYLFNLRKGVKFSNGRAMTADDVVGSLMRLIDPKLAASWQDQPGIRDVVRTGDEQVKIMLTRPRTSFLTALANMPAAILPMRELDAGTFDPKKEMLGTGPFKVESHVANASWTFVRNPYYWRSGIPKIAKITVRIMPDDAARIAALHDGSIDVTTFENVDSVRLLKNQANIKTVVQATTDYYRLDVNAKSSIFRDNRLRQALALSIDRAKIRDVALAAVGRVSAAVSPAYAGICDPSKVPFATPDLQRARALVAAAGATGKTIQIITSPVTAMSSPIAQVIQRNLQDAGLKVRLVSLDLGTLLSRVYNGKTADFDLSVSWFAGYGDPAMSPARYNPDITNFNKAYTVSDPDLNVLIDQALATAPGAERTKILRSECDRIASDANIIPLVTKDNIIAYRPDRVTPAIDSLEGYALPLRNIAEFGVK